MGPVGSRVGGVDWVGRGRCEAGGTHEYRSWYAWLGRAPLTPDSRRTSSGLGAPMSDPAVSSYSQSVNAGDIGRTVTVAIGGTHKTVLRGTAVPESCVSNYSWSVQTGRPVLLRPTSGRRGPGGPGRVRPGGWMSRRGLGPHPKALGSW